MSSYNYPKQTATFVPLAFARLRAKVILIRIAELKTLAVKPFAYFYNYKNSRA
jgi:hypothetical protein